MCAKLIQNLIDFFKNMTYWKNWWWIPTPTSWV